MTIPPDDRSPAAKAYQWASRIMIVSLEMVLPGLAGYWLDLQLGTVVVFMVIGMAVGCTGGMWHLMRMISAENLNVRRNKKSNEVRGE